MIHLGSQKQFASNFISKILVYKIVRIIVIIYFSVNLTRNIQRNFHLHAVSKRQKEHLHRSAVTKHFA